MATNQDVDLAFQRAGVGHGPSDADYKLYTSNPWFSDAGKVEGDVRAGGGGTTYNSWQQNQQQQKTDALAAQQKADLNQQFANDKQEVTDFGNKYATDTQNVVNNTSSKYHLDDLAGITNALDSKIKQLQGNTDNSGGDGVVSNDQVSAAVEGRYLPQFQTAVTNQNNSTQLAQTEENQLLQPDQTMASLLNDRLAREMTGFTQEQQNELEGLIASINAGVTLTNAQQERANQLAIAEEGYQNALNQTKLNNQNIVLPSGDTYYNAATGVTYNPFVHVASR